MAEFYPEETYRIQGYSLLQLADIVREKIGQNVPMSLEQMGNYIANLNAGELPGGALVISGNCSWAFASPYWDWYLNFDGVTTSNITNASYMFHDPNGEDDVVFSGNIPFDINIVDGCNCSWMFDGRQMTEVPTINGAIGDAMAMFNQSYEKNATLTFIGDLTFDNSQAHNYKQLFNQQSHLTNIGTLTNMRPSSLSYMFNSCYRLRHLPQFVNLDTTDLVYYGYMFSDCYSLRSVPEDLLKQFSNVTHFSNSNSIYYLFNNCYSLDEVKGLACHNGASTSNMLGATFQKCHRLKEIIFATQEDGTPYTAEWANQTINLSYGIGYVSDAWYITYIVGYNSGITYDTRISDATTYAALKNDPDWWTSNSAYSRYNHDSAVNTINSLPDTSAYLAANGGTNTIKFKGASGSDTDGGAINTLTAEEIAVAAAKGWTVTLS